MAQGYWDSFRFLVSVNPLRTQFCVILECKDGINFLRCSCNLSSSKTKNRSSEGFKSKIRNLRDREAAYVKIGDKKYMCFKFFPSDCKSTEQYSFKCRNVKGKGLSAGGGGGG